MISDLSNSESGPVATAYREAMRFYRRSYVTGISVGEPLRGGEYLPKEIAICIHVSEKFPESQLTKRQIFPKEIKGIPVDVCERTFTARQLSDDERAIRQLDPADPARPGVQVGNGSGTEGTFGMVVIDRRTGEQCILSAAHILYDPESQDIFQPGKLNQGMPIATVLRSMWNREGDAAIAHLNRLRAVDGIPLGLDAPIQGVRWAQRQDILIKSGARTGVTQGLVTKIGQFDVSYPSGRSQSMQGFEIRPLNPADRSEISDEGDSGSVWYEPNTGLAVGMTVGGDQYGRANPDEWAFACHLPKVFEGLLISL